MQECTGNIARLFPDGEDVGDDGGEDPACGQGFGDSRAVGDPFAGVVDFTGNDRVSDDFFHDTECLEDGNAIGKEGGERAGELGVGGGFDDAPEGGEA